MGHIWNDDEVEYLKENYPFAFPSTLEKEMDIPKEEIKKKALELQIEKIPIRHTKTDTDAPCGGCRKWHPIEAFGKNAKSPRGLQDYCKEYNVAYRKENPIDKATMDKYIKTTKKNKEIKALKESPEYQKEMLFLRLKKETEDDYIVCSVCGVEKIGRDFRFRRDSMKRVGSCKQCEKELLEQRKAKKILEGTDY